MSCRYEVGGFSRENKKTTRPFPLWFMRNGLICQAHRLSGSLHWSWILFQSLDGVGLAGLTRADALQRMGGLRGVGRSVSPGPAPSRETATPSSLLAQESTPEGWESVTEAGEKGRDGLTEHLPISPESLLSLSGRFGGRSGVTEQGGPETGLPASLAIITPTPLTEGNWQVPPQAGGHFIRAESLRQMLPLLLPFHR